MFESCSTPDPVADGGTAVPSLTYQDLHAGHAEAAEAEGTGALATGALEVTGAPEAAGPPGGLSRRCPAPAP